MAVARRLALTTIALVIPLVLAAGAAGCGVTRGAGTQAPALVAPERIADLDDYADARNAFALLEFGEPGRAELRAELRDFLIGYLDHALAEARDPAAVDALEHLAGLWTPAELRALSPDPRLAEAATRVYAAVAPAGNERPALLALGLAHAFGDGTAQARASANFEQLQAWVERTSDFDEDPRVADLLDRLLEDVTSFFPSPFLVDQLATLYLDRYRAAQLGTTTGKAKDPRTAFTPYLLARLYLRADDLDGAIAAIDRLESDAPTLALRELIAAANQSSAEARSPADLDQLTREFTPEPDNRLPAEIIRQSWGIVDNLARRTLAGFPDHPPAHLARGRVLRSQELDQAAIVHYERAFAGKSRATDREDLHLAWTELAELHQRALEARAQANPVAAAAMLDRVEAFHARAAQLWPQRPVEPPITFAWLTVAQAEFNAGQVDRAKTLLDQTVAIEPHPAALSLLGLIALRRGDFEQARERIKRIEGLAFADQLERYEWQIDSQIRLGEIELLAGNDAASVAHLRDALVQLNTLLSYPGLADPIRVEFLLRRAQTFFFLGEISSAMADYRGAQTIAPERSAVYSLPLLFTVVHGHFDEAAEVLNAALAGHASGDASEAADLRVYFSMWVMDLGQRIGRPVPPAAQAYLKRYASEGSDAWLRKLARFGLGELGEGDLAAAASDARQRSEAFFYEGLRRWRSGSKTGGLALLEQVLAQKMLGDFEYQMAQSYLHWNELPKRARAALVASPR